jgi:hypothetical protein
MPTGDPGGHFLLALKGTTLMANAPSDTTVILNSVVKRCNAAYEDTLAAELAKGTSNWQAVDRAGNAYLRALPNLTAINAVRAYIACIGRAMTLGIVKKNDGSKLLYAAQVALASLPKPTPPPGRPAAK